MDELINIYIDENNTIFLNICVEDIKYSLVFPQDLIANIVFIRFISDLADQIKNNNDKIELCIGDIDSTFITISYNTTDLFEILIENKYDAVLSIKTQELCNVIINKLIEFGMYCKNNKILKS